MSLLELFVILHRIDVVHQEELLEAFSMSLVFVFDSSLKDVVENVLIISLTPLDDALLLFTQMLRWILIQLPKDLIQLQITLSIIVFYLGHVWHSQGLQFLLQAKAFVIFDRLLRGHWYRVDDVTILIVGVVFGLLWRQLALGRDLGNLVQFITGIETLVFVVNVNVYDSNELLAFVLAHLFRLVALEVEISL